MTWRSARWLLAGVGIAVVLGAVGSVIVALRRGILLADEEANLALPPDETTDAEDVRNAHGSRSLDP